jgi:DNA helicase-2/ATP-dependent DNA helicase PcrA
MNETVNIFEAINQLNPAQKQAVEAVDGPLLIMAGAGSGKTRVLTHRIAYLIATNKAAPWNIMALTFTNKAAREMQERVSRLVGPSGRDIWVSTFHSMCVRMLRKDIERIGYTSNFTILDSTDQLSVVRGILKQLNVDPKKFDPKAILSAMSSAKNELLTAKAYEQTNGGYFEEVVAKVYLSYEKKLRSNNALDFDDLIMKTIELFREVPEVLQFYQHKFQYIHVDEYQDTNRAQYLLCKMIADQHHRICVVGDSDQSIYRWRGADIRNILTFEKDYPNAITVMLEQNYRSTANILNAANGVIALNQGRKPKNLWTDQGEGQKLKIFQAGSEHEEGYFIAKEINNNKAQGKNYNDHAILYRTNAQSRVIEEILIKSDIPYQIIGGTRFYDRKEIKDILAYLRLISNPNDDSSFNRIINVPKRGIGAASVDKLAERAAAEDDSLFSTLYDLEYIDIGGKANNSLQEFKEMIANLNQMIDYLSVTELTEKVLEMTQYREQLILEGTIEAKSRLENIEEFISVTLDFEKRNEDKSLISFLTDLALIADIDAMDEDGEVASKHGEKNAVILMTMHSAKGLEFPVVFIAGMEEGVFPHSRTFGDDEELEEERRLAYVGITRAEQQLFLTCASMRMLFGKTAANAPSRFLMEIPEEVKEVVSLVRDSYGYGSGGSSYGRNTGGATFGGPRANSVSKPSSTSGSSGHTGVNSKLKVNANQASGDKPSLDYDNGDKVSHNKWGVGTVVSVKGTGDDTELQIAFPAPTGIKRLLARFAPITKVDK